MAGFARLVLVLSLVLVGPMSASACGFRVLRNRSQSYYYSAPVAALPVFRVIETPEPAVYGVPVMPECVPTMQPARPPVPYAQPTPAPPSSTPASPSPSMRKVPEVTESRSFYSGASQAPAASDKPAADRSSVAFWNLSTKDVNLRIGGQTYVLAQGKRLNLEMGRQFVWRIDDRELQNETIPATESALEIVIRR